MWWQVSFKEQRINYWYVSRSNRATKCPITKCWHMNPEMRYSGKNLHFFPPFFGSATVKEIFFGNQFSHKCFHDIFQPFNNIWISREKKKSPRKVIQKFLLNYGILLMCEVFFSFFEVGMTLKNLAQIHPNHYLSLTFILQHSLAADIFFPANLFIELFIFYKRHSCTQKLN